MNTIVAIINTSESIADLKSLLIDFLGSHGVVTTDQQVGSTCVIMSDGHAKVPAEAPADPAPADAPVEAAADAPVEAPAVEVPAEMTIELPAATAVAGPKWPYSEARIMSLDSNLWVPTSYDPSRSTSTLRCTVNVDEQDSNGLKFTFGDKSYSIPSWVEEAESADNVRAFSTLINFKDHETSEGFDLKTNNFHVKLVVEQRAEDEPEQLIFGTDAEFLITAHGETSDAVIS